MAKFLLGYCGPYLRKIPLPLEQFHFFIRSVMMGTFSSLSSLKMTESRYIISSNQLSFPKCTRILLYSTSPLPEKKTHNRIPLFLSCPERNILHTFQIPSHPPPPKKKITCCRVHKVHRHYKPYSEKTWNAKNSYSMNCGFQIWKKCAFRCTPRTYNCFCKKN